MFMAKEGKEKEVGVLRECNEGQFLSVRGLNTLIVFDNMFPTPTTFVGLVFASMAITFVFLFHGP